VASSGTLYRPPSRLITAHPSHQTVQINVPDHVSTEYDLEDVARVCQRGVEFDPDEEADSLNEVVMAVDIRDRGTVGCSYYVAREEKLYFMEDIKLGGPDIIEACKSTSALSCQD
jgi:DNA mismatch repair protein MSH5